MASETKGHSYVMALEEVGHREVGRVGAKAANLGELARAGFPVPDGFVLTTDAFHRFLDANARGPNGVPEEVTAASLPPELSDAIRLVAGYFNGARLAVRSSGVAEDLPDASFAGQYETVLDVKGEEALLAAVRRCWASAFGHRVQSYREGRQQEGGASMAVLVQRLVPADAAGVAFTVNPVTGDRQETVVSAVRGLGERLVSGQTTPDEWLVRGNEVTCRSAPEGAIDDTWARAVAELASRVEAHFGVPQDVEWATAGGKLYLLQARPITALPTATAEAIALPIEPPPGFWERDATHFPEPLSPMFRSALLPAHNAAIKPILSEASAMIEAFEFREIGGWVYQRMVPLGGKDRPAPPAWLLPLVIRLVPKMRQRIKGMVQVVRSDKLGSFVDRWHQEWKPGQITRLAELRAVELVALSDEALEQHLLGAVAFVHESLVIHAMVTAIDFLTADLAFACRDLLGWDDRRTLDLLVGLSEATSEPSVRLAALANLAKERPALRALLDHIDDNTIERLVEIDPPFAVAFAAYQREFGCRPLRFELLEPTLEEQPALVLGLLRDQIARGYDPASNVAALQRERAAALLEARAALANRSPRDRERFERALARAERACPIRDDHEFYLTGAPFGLLRHTLLEIGSRLAQRGQLADRGDVLFLEIEEARAALKEGGDRKPVAARRTAERVWALAHPGPASYGKPPGPPPSLAAFPPEARYLMESMLWYMERTVAPRQSGQAQAAASASVRGIAAAPGRFTGPVRVIMTEGEFGKLRAGDVLVCPATSPVWSVLFSSVGALVSDSGGILSHPAIIAREYRIPAVVATGNATSLLRDGQTVTVDGNAGVVEPGL